MESELERLVDTLPGLIWTALPDGRSDFINQRWCEYTGLSPDEALGQGWHSAIHPDDLGGLLEGWTAFLTSGAGGELEARLRRFDGECRWFRFSARPIADASGQIVKWCGINIDIEDQKRAEKAAQAREDHYRLVADSIPAQIAFMTPDGEVEIVNRQVLDYFGTTLEELKGWGIGQSVHPDDLPDVIAAWQQAVSAGEPYHAEFRMRRSDGAYLWFRVNGLPLWDEEGVIARWYVLQTNIDDRKRAERLLAGERRLLELVAKGEPLSKTLSELCELVEATSSGSYCGVTLVDPAGTHLQHGAAPSLPDSYNQSISGRPVNAESGPCAMAVYLNQQVIADDIPSESRWADYAWPPLALAHNLKACWSTPIASAGGRAIGAFAIYYTEPTRPTPQHQELIAQFTHIASIAIERAQTLEALKLSEARKTAILDSALDGVVTIDHLGRITEFNPACERTFGYRREEVLGKPIANVIIPPFLRERHRQGLARYVATGEARVIGKRQEMTAMRADGSEFPIEIAITRIPLQGPPTFTAYLRDITERKQAEEALGKVRSELAHMARVTSLGALTASIAHEVNQPLSGIITNTSTCLKMLAADPPNVAGALETARRTMRDGGRAADIIKRLRAMFSKEAGAVEAVDLNEATREVIALSWSELQKNQVILRTDLTEDLPPVAGDRIQLQQVILNLLLNASDAMGNVDDRPRQLVVTTEQAEGDQVRLIVQDVGAGFDPQEPNRLFEAFYTTKSRGMGIGLSVSRSIIESHQGRLQAQPNDGPGATFYFTLPRMAAQLETEGSSGQTPSERLMEAR